MESRNEKVKSDKEKVVNLSFYRIKRSLKKEGFELIANEQGKLTLVLRTP